MQVSLQEGSDEEGSQSWEGDPFYQWYSNKEEPALSVRTVRQEPSTKPRIIEVILDSGADVSIPPSRMRRYGRKVQVMSVQHLMHKDDPMGQWSTVSSTVSSRIKIKKGSKAQVSEVFMIRHVINPLLAIGKMMKQGWMLHVVQKSSQEKGSDKPTTPWTIVSR